MFSKEQAVEFIYLESKIAWEEFSQVYNCGAIPIVNVIYNKTSTAGWAFRKSGKVEFNLRFAMIAGPDYIRTIRHELAHIIQYRIFPNASQAHGPEFKMILSSIGADPSRCHSYSVAAAKSLKIKVELIDLISAEEM